MSKPFHSRLPFPSGPRGKPTITQPAAAAGPPNTVLLWLILSGSSICSCSLPYCRNDQTSCIMITEDNYVVLAKCQA